jgi:hypothetical protein
MKECSMEEIRTREADVESVPNRVFALTAPPPLPDIVIENPPSLQKQGWKRPYKYHK